MAYEGKYLAETPKGGKAHKSPKKKGGVRPWMIVIAVILVLVIGVCSLGYGYYKSMLGNVKRAEYEEKNQDKSFEDLIAQMNGGSAGGEVFQEDTQAEDNAEETNPG